MAVTEVNGRFVAVCGEDLAEWYKSHELIQGEWCLVRRSAEGLLADVYYREDPPFHLKDQANQYMVDKTEANRKNRFLSHEQMWSSAGVPYSKHPEDLAAADSDNGSGPDLQAQLEGRLTPEQELTVLRAQYDDAIRHWDHELKRANRAEKELSSLQKEVSKDVRYQNMSALLAAKIDENWALDRLIDSLKDQLCCYEKENQA